MFTIGCDPELFLVDALGAFKSSIGRIGGSKEAPLPLPLGDGFAVQEDNVAIEFNIPPAQSEGEFNESVGKALAFLEDNVRSTQGLAFSKVSATSFPWEELNTPAAFVFGCDPDYNAWTRRKNPPPSSSDKTLRSCGGHVHIGMEMDEEMRWRLGRLMDFYVGVPSTLLDDGELRKQLYGKRGAIRLKPYGIEYRTLSNFWVFSETLRKWVYRATSSAVDALLNGEDVLEHDAAVLQAINKNNREVAQALVSKNNLLMPNHV